MDDYGDEVYEDLYNKDPEVLRNAIMTKDSKANLPDDSNNRAYSAALHAWFECKKALLIVQA